MAKQKNVKVLILDINDLQNTPAADLIRNKITGKFFNVFHFKPNLFNKILDSEIVVFQYKSEQSVVKSFVKIIEPKNVELPKIINKKRKQLKRTVFPI